MKTFLLNLIKLFTLVFSLISLSENNSIAQQTIYSIGSGSWNNPLVWSCSCVPTENDDVIINQYNYVIIADSAFVNNLEIYPNGELNMLGNKVLKVSGNIDAVGVFNLSSGQLLLSSLNEQYVDVSENEMIFNDLTIDNINNHPVVFYNGNYQLNGTLTPINGGMVLDNSTNNTFTFTSQSETTNARIAQVQNSFFFEGKYTVERQIPSGPTDIRTISASVKDGVFADWNESAGIYGPGMPDGCVPWLDTCIYTLNYTVDGISTAVVDITDSAQVAVGYEFLLGNDSLTFTGATISMTGTPNDNIEIESLVGDGWDTKGNPYISAIDFNELARSGVANFFYVYSAQTGSFEWYDGSNNTSSSPEIENGIIAPGQGFYVSGPGLITFTDSSKTDQSASFIKTDEPELHSFLLSLSKDNSTQQCKMSFAVDQIATDGFDNGKDIPHLMNGKEKASSIGVSDGGFIIRKNYFNSNSDTKNFELFSRITSAGEYTLSLSSFEEFVDYNTIQLYDNYTGVTFNLKKGNYHFYSESGDFNRFSLILSNSVAQTEETSSQPNNPYFVHFNATSNILEITNNLTYDENASIFIYSVSGSVVSATTNELLSSGLNTIRFEETPGVYLITIETASGKYLQKIVL